MYSMKDLSRLTGKTEQTIYRLGRENSDFKTVLEANQRKVSNGKRYGENVLNWLLSYYEITPPTEPDPCAPSVSVQKPSVPEPSAPLDETIIRENEALRGQIEALKRENELLRSQLSEAALREHTHNEQLGHALLNLGQALQQTQLLLAAPKQTMFQRLKQLFNKPQQAQTGEGQHGQNN